MRTATMRLGDRTFVPKACEWCGSTDISYESIGPHIQAKCNKCGKKWFVKQIDEAEWARLVKERAGYRCERCGKPVQGRGAHAHHLRPQWFMPDYSLDVNNGICLCTECHKQIHGGCGTIREGGRIMKILYKAPGEALRSMVIPNELGVMQQLVDGNIEPVRLSDNLIVICNEEGKINDMKKNFHIAAINDWIFGPALFMGADGEEFCSIKPEHEKLIRDYFDVFGTEGFNGK